MVIIHTCIADIYSQAGQKPETLSMVQEYDLNTRQRICAALLFNVEELGAVSAWC